MKLAVIAAAAVLVLTAAGDASAWTCNSGTKRTTVTQMATSITTSSTNLGIGSVTKGFRCGELMGTGMNQFTQGQGHGYWAQGSGGPSCTSPATVTWCRCTTRTRSTAAPSPARRTDPIPGSGRT